MNKGWRKKDNDKSTEVLKSENIEKKYLDIWKINPSYKDIHSNIALVKAGFLLFLTLFFTISTFYFTHSLFSSIGIGILTIFFFIISFHDDFYSLENLTLFKSHKFVQIYPFRNLVFWYLNNKEQDNENFNTIYFTNKKDLMNVGMRIFKIEIVPEDNLPPILNQFIKALSKLQIPYSYQVVQSPFIKFPENIFKLEKRQEAMNSLEFINTSIYFSVYYYVRGILNQQKILLLQEKIRSYANSLNANFKANFHHFKIKSLFGNNLINGLRSMITKTDKDCSMYHNDSSISKNEISKLSIKIFCIIFVIIYLSQLLSNIRFSISLIILIDISMIFLIILLWWRELFFQFIKNNLKNLENIPVINPFKDISFYKIKDIPDSIFIYVNSLVLMDVKIYNLKYVSPGQWYFPDKFFRSVMSQKIPFTYNAIMAPINIETFNKEGFPYLKEYEKQELLNNHKTNIESANWLSWRSGVWRTILNISVASYRIVPILKNHHFLELEEDLSVKSDIIMNAFKMNFPSFLLLQLEKRDLLSGFLSIVLKNKFFRFNGTHLNYILFQGKNLIKLTTIVNELKKGIETRVAAEFNTPLNLENFIKIGYTINTEFLEEEIPVGFKLEQLKNLLLLNGNWENQQALIMKIISELVKANIPSIIFDYTGSWSKIISIFEDSCYKDDFLYFKLGTTFNLNLLHSGIPYDTNNVEYLNYIFDVYSMLFKKDEKTMEVLKNTILKNPELDLSSIALEYQGQKSWEKNMVADSLIALFNDFSQQAISFFHTPINEGQNNTILDFIKDDRTIIIDLSILRDLRLQVFASFIILSKIVHYLNTNENYCEKIMILPNIDLIFDNFYLDKNINYWKIDKFLAPLIKANFGLIFTSNEIRYLHPNLFNYIKNLITFKTKDSRDIQILRNYMYLDEVHGTGYYSSKRKSAYQLEFLISMMDDEFLIKRSDFNQPFPGKIDLDEFNNSIPLSYQELIEYMEQQGYDIKNSEKKIIEQTKKTLFEKDLGHFSIFLEELIRFLNALKTVDKIGNLYKTKIKDELKRIIYPKASKITKNKMKLLKIREELFEVLIKHGYLVENHPKKASGSESIRTSFSVGPKYEKALKDYFNTKKSSVSKINIETIEKSSENKEVLNNFFQEKSNEEIINELEFREALIKETGSFLLYNLYKMNNHINNSNYMEALNIGNNFIEEFLVKLYKKVFEHNTDTKITPGDVLASIEYLSGNKKFPFNKEEILNYLNQSKPPNNDIKDLELKAKNIYSLLSNFSLKIQKELMEG